MRYVKITTYSSQKCRKPIGTYVLWRYKYIVSLRSRQGAAVIAVDPRIGPLPWVEHISFVTAPPAKSASAAGGLSARAMLA